MGNICCPHGGTPKDPEQIEADEAAGKDEEGKKGENERAANQYAPDPTEPPRTESTSVAPADIQLLISEGKKIMRALYDYESGNEGDLSFYQGDLMEIITEDGEWFQAKHLTTGDTGFIPSNYVAEEGSLENEDWYHSGILRKDAVKALTREGNPEGTFLIRDSEHFEGQFSLSVAIRDEKTDKLTTKHYRIRLLDNGGFYITAKYTFTTLHELVEKYSEEEYGLCHALCNPCPKSTPMLKDLSHSTRDKWEIERSTIELQEMIGKGQFGEVHKAMWNKTRAVAVKTLKTGTMTTDAFLEEAQVMKSLTHKNIVQLLAVCTEEDPIFIITEYLENGSLLAYLRARHDDKLDVPVLLEIAANVAEGMEYIEKRQLIHRDLAARNILLGSDLTAKVADFGLAKDNDVYEASQGTKFPVKWTAPEAALRQIFTIKSDVWSFGIVLVEIITHGIIPYPGLGAQDVLAQIDKGMRHRQPPGCPDALYELMCKCWMKNPLDRPTFEHLADTLQNFPVAAEHSYEER